VNRQNRLREVASPRSGRQHKAWGGGTAGVPPAKGRQTLRRWGRLVAKHLSRFALIAGGTPAVPVCQFYLRNRRNLWILFLKSEFLGQSRSERSRAAHFTAKLCAYAP
jgi:hypothetical protein